MNKVISKYTDMNKTKVIYFLILLCFYSNIYLHAKTSKSIDVTPHFRSEKLNPQTIIKVGENHYFIDFGKDSFGTLSINSKSVIKDTLIVHLGEKLNDNNLIDRKPGGSIRYQQLKLTNIPQNSEYIVKLKADKRNTNPPAITLPDSFGVIMPFRYCEIENLKVPISDLDIKQKVYNYKFNDSSSGFKCSDSVLNQVWDLCKYSIKATSFAGLYIDGERERIPYEADAYINQLSHYCVDNEYSLARRTNEYFVNHATWPTEWILHTVLLFYYDYQYTGDVEPLVKHYNALKSKTLVELEREDGLISSKSPLVTKELLKSVGLNRPMRDIVDWPAGERDGYEMTEVNTVVNSFHFFNLKLMAEIAGRLGKKTDSVYFYNKSVLVKNTINQKLFDSSKGIYIDGENSKHASLHANMFPLAFGIVPAENQTSVVEFVKSRGMACSVYGAQYLLEALYKHGEADYALSLMTSKSNRSWWNMIQSGSTITMEAWDMKIRPSADWNHAWGAAPANIISRNMWGVTPAAPGFAKVKIKPQLSNLTFSNIKVPTIKGTITEEFNQLPNGNKVYVIVLPKDMKGEFALLQTDKSEIFLNNKKIIPNNNSVKISSGSNKIEIKNKL